MAIERGSLVGATTASGRVVTMRALGVPVRGRDFPVLWVCTEDEWVRAQKAGEEPDGLPWPLEDVSEMTPA